MRWCGAASGPTRRLDPGAVDERDPDPLNVCWTLLPGLDLVAMRAFGVVEVFYVVGDEEAVTAWKPGEAQR